MCAGQASCDFTVPLLEDAKAITTDSSDCTYGVPHNIAKQRLGVRPPSCRFSHRPARLYILRGSIGSRFEVRWGIPLSGSLILGRARGNLA
jgi:hypothetical protein